MLKRLIPYVLGLALLPGLAAAQLSTDDDIVDRVAALVGDSVVLQSQVMEAVQRVVLTQNTQLPEPGPELELLMSEMLEQLVSTVLISQEAARDSLIEVDDVLIEERVTEEIAQVTQRVGGQVALRQSLAGMGLTLAEYRDMRRSEIRQEQLQQMFMQSRLRGAPPIELTDDEVLAAFQAARGQLDQRPKLVTFDQVVMMPTPTEASVDSARTRLEGLLSEIRAGADFAELATEHSDDPSGPANGGDLGWFRRGSMVREFEEAAFALPEGGVSDIVETQYGLHIIKVERFRVGERRARHILLIPQVTETDLQRMRDIAAEVLAKVQDGADIEPLIAQYADPEAPDSVTVEFERISSFPPGYDAIATASSGDVIGPIEYDTGQGTKRIAVVRVTNVREAGAYTFEDLRGQLSDRLRQQKQIARILEELRARTHIEIRQ
jgi:peptidyl-prolyl cis-trans isomerase SurA